MKNTSPRSRAIFISYFAGLVICFTIFLSLQKNSGWGWAIAIGAVILGTFLLGQIFNKFFVDFLLQQATYLSKSQMIVWGTLCFLAGIWLVLNIPIPSPPHEFNPGLPSIIVKFGFLISAGFGIGLVLFLCSLWLAKSLPGNKRSVTPRIKAVSILKYFIPLSLVWGIYLLAFYPGMMSADSMDQWGQMLTGQYVNHHPVFHTLLIWLFTRIYLSPVTIAIAQIIAMAWVAASWFVFFERIGINRWIIGIVAIVFAVVPVNGTMVNTLWKDIPYGIAVLGLTLILAKFIFSRGESARTWLTKISLGITLVFVALLRHDGLILACGTLFFVLIFYPVRWKSWLVSAIVFAFFYLGIRYPLYNWVGTRQTTELTESTIPLYDLAAYSIPGGQADQYLSALKIYPPNWNCSVWSGLNPNWRETSLDQSQSFFHVAGNLINHLPLVLVYDYRCERSMEWIIWDPYGEVRNASHVEVLDDPNPYGIRPASLLPAFRDWVTNVVIKTSHDTSINWFLWRPAIFLYFTLFLTAVLVIRNRDLRFVLLSIPVLFQAITFTLILALPNFRYHYATYLVALITIPLLFSPSSFEQASPTNSNPITE